MSSTATTDKTWARVRTTFAALCLSAVILALFHSNGMVSWAYDLPINPLSEQIVTWFETWNGWMEQIGFTEFSEQISDWIQSLQDMIF